MNPQVLLIVIFVLVAVIMILINHADAQVEKNPDRCERCDGLINNSTNRDYCDCNMW